MDETHSNRDATIPAIRGVLLTSCETPPQIVSYLLIGAA
jgi:hypothetical protein